MITRTLVWRSAIVLLGLVIVWAHLIAPDEYVWTVRTISDLGSQGYPLAWLMRAGFLIFGILLLLSLWTPGEPSQVGLVQILIIGYGVAIGASGLWSAEPFLDGVPPDLGQSLGHTIAANVAGVLLIAAMVVSAITASGWRPRLLHLVAMLLVTMLSLMFKLSQAGEVDVPTGVVQRLIFLSGLSWVWLRAGGKG